MENQLTELLARFQQQSDYAETKLGVLIAFSSAIIIGTFSVFSGFNSSTSPSWMLYYGIVIILLNMIGLLFAFSGIYGKTNNQHSSTNKISKENYYYFQYVSSLHPSSLIEGLKEDYKLKSTNTKKENDLANQVVVLARNAERKFRFFNLSLSCVIASIITPLGLLIFHIYNNPN